MPDSCLRTHVQGNAKHSVRTVLQKRKREEYESRLEKHIHQMMQSLVGHIQDFDLYLRINKQPSNVFSGEENSLGGEAVGIIIRSVF